MSFQKARQLLELAMWMQSRSDGVTYQEMADKYAVSTRTAMRMREEIEGLFDDVIEMPSETQEKRWRLEPGRLDRLIGLSASDFAALENAEKLFHRDGLKDEAETLSALHQKLRTSMRPSTLCRIEPDLELLIDNETFVAKPGPILPLEDGVYGCLKEAILGSRQIIIRYRSRDGKASNPTLEPYGFLFGHRHYLLAINPKKRETGIRTYSLPGIKSIEIQKQCFARDDKIDLQHHVSKSFGIFVEDDGPYDVIWKFHPSASDTAAEFQFHPTQQTQREQDGSLVVQFKAGGIVEMAWHLLMWGNKVDVIQPKVLREKIKDLQIDWGTLP